MSALAGSEPERAGAEPEKPGGTSSETAPESVGPIILDASVLIGHLDNNDPHHVRAVSLLGATDGQVLGASTITLAETLVAPARAGRLADAQAALSRLGVRELENDGFAWLRCDGLKWPRFVVVCCVLDFA